MSKTTKPTPAPWEGDDVIGSTIRDLPVILDDMTRLERGIELARQNAAVDSLDESQKTYLSALRSHQKADMSAALKERDRLVTAVSIGEEPQPVLCIYLADYSGEQVTTIRVDTSEIIATRPILASEKQVTFAKPLYVVANKTTGKLQRADGSDLDTLPFVLADQCAPQVCKVCEQKHGQAHAEDCDLLGVGDASIVVADQCEDRVCLECDAAIGLRHADTCPHSKE